MSADSKKRSAAAAALAYRAHKGAHLVGGSVAPIDTPAPERKAA